MVFLAKQIDKAVEGRNNQPVTLHGAVHALRDMGGITFVTLRTPPAWSSASAPKRMPWTGSPRSAPSPPPVCGALNPVPPAGKS